MAYRPYPSTDRALHQLDRHVHYEDAPVLTMSPAVAQLMQSLTTGLVRALPTPEQVAANMAAAFRMVPSARPLAAVQPDPGIST